MHDNSSTTADPRYRTAAMARVAFVASVIAIVSATLLEGSEPWKKTITREQTLTLSTCAWHDDVNPVFAEFEGAIYYPYSRQDHIEKTRTERTYRAIVLENEYLKVTCLPELGGRIHSVFDKTTNHEMFHANNEIKPAPIAMRGAWVSGGIEWNVGPHGHAVTVMSPVDVTIVENGDGSASLVIGNTEKMFRTRWTVRVTLHPGKAYLDEWIRLFNPTDGVHPYYFWNCTAFPQRSGTRFIFPMTLGTDHDGRSFYTWPIHEGKDLSWLKNYETMTALFAYHCDFDFFGGYDVEADRGIVSFADHRKLPGKKAWTWGTDDFGVVSQMSLSDAGREGAPYIEIQTGPLLTQSDFGILPPGEAVEWREFWYPVHGLKTGFEYATQDVAIQTARSQEADTLQLRLVSTAVFPDAEIELRQNAGTLLKQNVDLSPEEPATVTLDSPPPSGIDIVVRDRNDNVLAEFTTPLPIPKVDPPHPGKQPADLKDNETLEEQYRNACRADSQSNPAAARQAYTTVLDQDPSHVGARLGIAALDMESGHFDRAVHHLEKIIQHDQADPPVETRSQYAMAWYLLGVCRLYQERDSDALACATKLCDVPGKAALADNLLGRSHMRMGNHTNAVEAFGRAVRRDPNDIRNRDYWLAARLAAGDREQLLHDARLVVRQHDPTAFVPRAIVALSGNKIMNAFAHDLHRISGDQEFTAIEAANFFANLNMHEQAICILDSVVTQPGNVHSGALLHYYLAWWCHKTNRNSAAELHMKQASQADTDGVFPSRTEALEVLDYAIRQQPLDANAHLLMGHLLAGLHRIDEAIPYWKTATGINPGLGVAWRMLGLYAWKKEQDLQGAEQYFRKALAARPRDQSTCRDLAAVMTLLEKRSQAIRIVEDMPVQHERRYDLSQWLADAYLAEKRYDDCIALLESTRFSNLEGSSRPHDTFVKALLARGQDRYGRKQYAAAITDFEKSLTFPENLGVGRRYNQMDAESRYWLAKTLIAMDRIDEARTVLETGAGQEASHESVKRCAELLDQPPFKDG